MKVIAENTIRGGWFAHGFNPPELAGVFLAKLTCKLHPDAVATLLSEEGVVELTGDVPHDDDLVNPLKLSSDFAPFKPRFDLLMHAASYSPSRKPEPSWDARWRVGEWSKSLRVFGDRQWIVEPLSFRASQPAPVAKLKVDYRGAYGGPSSTLNPVGKGFGLQAQQLPNIEDPQHPIKTPSDTSPPAGFGPISPGWRARQRWVGTYDDSWKSARWPWFPKDFDYAYFNAAPLDQQLQRSLNGDEELVFENLHLELSNFRSRLPGVRVRCFLSERPAAPDELSATDFREVPLQFDTLQIDMEQQIATLLFRGQTPIQSLKMTELQTVFLMTESIAEPPLSAAECMTRFSMLVHADDDEPEDPAERAAEEASQQETEKQMEALEIEYATAMKEAEQHEAEAVKRAIAAGIDPAKFDQPDSTSLSELKSQLMELANSLRATQPSAASEIEAQFADIDELTAIEAEMKADAGEALTREDVVRMAADRESFHGRSLSDLELHELDLSGLDFSDVDFSESMLDGTNLSGANLTNANFGEADLTDADLSGACLDHADFSEAIVEGCNFAHTSIEQTVFSELDLKGCNFRSAHGSGADFSEAKLAGVDFSQAVLPRADFSEAELNQAVFDRAQLKDASFDGVAAAGVRMREANLSGVRASDQADFTGGDFSRCTADGSVWEQSILDRCDFTESTFRQAIFTCASLAKSRFDRSDLTDSVFDDADLTAASLDQCNLLRASLDRAKLVDASLREANIYRAGFWNAQMAGMNRRGTRLIGTVLTDE